MTCNQRPAKERELIMRPVNTNIIRIESCINGYKLSLLDKYGIEIAAAVATDDLVRGYSSHSLSHSIELLLAVPSRYPKECSDTPLVADDPDYASDL